ncbi:MAG: hypothetical protein ACTSW7_00590 [Candidatus Thorarchaeota archaeon]|nr:MAG: hypothetical protein DRP42_02855 [Mycoplasmatota bacterium]HEC72600.1 hypothetical protein [Thermoplasmatales archaeon]
MKKVKAFECPICKKTKPISTSGVGTGYGKNVAGETICYDCCGKLDLQRMEDAKPGDRVHLYLNTEKHPRVVSNWPGSLKLNCYASSNGSHNIAGTREDVWFGNDEIGHWWGVQYGEYTQICHCTKLKRRSV